MAESETAYGTEKDAEKPEKSGKDDSAFLAVVIERARLCIEREQHNRKLQLDDLRFATLDQWPENVRSERENDPEGARPCITADKINQYISQVVNDEAQNRPAIKVRPVDDKGDVQTARVLQEKARHVEDLSSAQIAYLTAGRSAATIGDGYIRILTEYESEKSFDQEIAIKSCPDTFSVYLGPHTLPDGSDAEYGFVFEDIPDDRFKRENPKAKSAPSDFAGLGPDMPHWKTEHSVRVAEYFYFEYEPATLFFLADGSTVFEDEYKELPEPRPKIQDKRASQKKTTHWCKLTGVEKLESREFPSKYIPIVKVVGKETIIDGKRVSWGLVRPAKDALRAYNYWISAITEKISLAPKAPLMGAVGQFATHATKFDNMNRRNYSRLEYDPIEVGGQLLPPPQRVAPAPMEAAMLGMLPILEHDVQTALGMFKASVGNTEGDQSGRALLALQRESDTGTFHFPDNLNLSIRHVGRIVVDMIPRVHSVKKMLRLVGEDGTTGEAQIDPEQKVARREIKTAEGIKNIYNPGVGRYDVTVTSGPSYTTKRMEAAQVFSELAKGATDPVGAAVMRYLTVKNSDFTNSDEALAMLKAQIPPAIVAAAEPEVGQQKVPPQVAAMVAQMKQMLEQAGQKIQELESGKQEAMAKVAVQDADNKAHVQMEAAVQAEKNRLAREQFEFQKQLDIDKANHAAWIAEQKVAGEQEAQRKKLAFEQSVRDEDATHQKAVADVASANQGIAQMAEMMAAGFQNIAHSQEALMAAVTAPRETQLVFDAKGLPVSSVTRIAPQQNVTIQ